MNLPREYREHYDIATGNSIEHPRIDAFIEDVIRLGKIYGYSISHEDTNGAFILRTFTDEDGEWLRGAQIDESV